VLKFPNVVNNAETTFGNIPLHKLNIELGERGLKKANMIQHGVYHKNMRIMYRGKIVLTSYVQDCSCTCPINPSICIPQFEYLVGLENGFERNMLVDDAQARSTSFALQDFWSSTG
jgi:hypothetical protein